MKKQDFVLKAFQAGMFKYRHWVISVFAITQASDKKMKMPWSVVRTPAGVFFVNPETMELEKIEDAKVDQPICAMLDPIVLPAESFINVEKETFTTVGNLLFNCCAIIPAFGKYFPFITGSVNLHDLEAKIAKVMEDTPKDPNAPRKPDVIYVDQYLTFCKSFAYLTEFTQLCTWGVTEKAITPPPGRDEFMKSLLEKYKDELHKPETSARIDKELVEFDAAYLKGDPSENFLISGKSRNVVRKKLFLSYGSEGGLGTATTGSYIPNSLNQGWDFEKFPSMMNALRAGSFDRGAETMLGGEAVKWLLRASSNIQIKDGDCGAKIGLGVHVTDETKRMLVNSYVITQNGVKLVSSPEEAGEYLGKKLMIRSPMFCTLDKTDYCSVCLGSNLSRNKNAASTAVTQEGSALMLMFMAAMHGKQIALERMDLDTAFS